MLRRAAAGASAAVKKVPGLASSAARVAKVVRGGTCSIWLCFSIAAASVLFILAAVLVALSPTGPARFPAVNNALLAGDSVVEAARAGPQLPCSGGAALPTRLHLVCFALGTWDDTALAIESMWWARVVAARAAKKGLALTFSTTRDFTAADVIVVSNYLPRHSVLRALRRRAAHALAVLVVGENADKSHYADHYLGDVDIVFGYSRTLAAAAPTRFVRVPSWMIDWVPPETCALDALRADFGAAAWRARPHFASFVARHAPPPRPQLVAALTAVGPVLCPGRALHNAEWPAAALTGSAIGDKHALNRATRFAISPENSVGDGYVTEKIADALAAGAVPIYWGGDLPPDADVFNPARILLFAPGTGAIAAAARDAGAFATTEAIAARAAELDTDTDATRRFFEQPVLLPSAEAAAARTCDAVADVFLCALARLHIVAGDDGDAPHARLRHASRQGPQSTPQGFSRYVAAATAALVDTATDFLARDPFRKEWKIGV